MDKVNNTAKLALEKGLESPTKYAKEPRSRMQQPKSVGMWKGVSIGILSITALLGIAYIARAQTFRKKYFPNTYINGIDAGYKTPDEIEQIIRDEIANYEIVIKSRGNEDEIFKGMDVGLKYVSDSSLMNILEEQDILTWFGQNKKTKEFGVPTTASLDDKKFATAVSGLEALNGSKFVSPEDAKISEYISGKGYTIVPEVQGNTLDIQKAKEYIRDSMLTLKDEINLDTPDADVYIAPSLFSSDEELRTMKEQLNKVANVTINYSKGITLDGNTIHTWIHVNENNEISLDEEKIKEFVKTTLAQSYDTAYKPKTLKATGGKMVTIKGGDYGWKINQAVETGKIKELILAGESVERDPEFSQRAASLGENDYGNSYVEVNLASQTMYLYKDGDMILSSNFVSGNVARGWATPGGAYGITYTQKNATLNGEDYSTPVDYWMPFNRGIGFHDAPWRGAFGGEIYKTGGSHGCINLPPAVAKTLFAHVKKGFPVLCHFGGGTSQTTQEKVQKESEAAPVVEETVAPGETSAPENVTATAQETNTKQEAKEPKQAETKPAETAAQREQETTVILDDAPSMEETVSMQGPGGN